MAVREILKWNASLGERDRMGTQSTGPFGDKGIAQAVLAGGGETGCVMRALDWSKTQLGGVHTWPQSLRTALGICLNSRFPIAIYWGPDFLAVYNDGYAEILGGKTSMGNCPLVPRSMG